MTNPSDAVTPTPTEVYYSPKQIAALFNISRYTLRAWAQQGLPSVGFGKRRRFLKADVIAFLERK